MLENAACCFKYTSVKGRSTVWGFNIQHTVEFETDPVRPQEIQPRRQAECIQENYAFCADIEEQLNNNEVSKRIEDAL